MSNSFTFEGYTVRSLTERDRPFLEMQIKADEYHRDWLTADFFLKPKPGEDAWALEDEQGMVVFYFKTATAVRMYIQFPAITTIEDKVRNAAGMMKGLKWLGDILRHNKFREIIFDTKRAELANFAKKRLGFRDASGLLVRSIAPDDPAETPVEAWEPSPQTTERIG
jgi:hypothetical protein